jgi:hypothetical protein
MGRGWRRHEWSQPVDMKRQTNTGGGILRLSVPVSPSGRGEFADSINTDNSYNPSLSERQNEQKK